MFKMKMDWMNIFGWLFVLSPGLLVLFGLYLVVSGINHTTEESVKEYIEKMQRGEL